MKHGSKEKQEISWPGTVVRKLLNIPPGDSDYSADSDDGDDNDSDSEKEEFFESCNGRKEGPPPGISEGGLPRLRRRKSETFRAQYINTKEIRISVGTWNVGGQTPPDNLYIDDWIDIDEPADIYVFGIQEIVPLNAGNILGSEDSRPVPVWENIIRKMLNRIRPGSAKVKCYTAPSSPSKFKAFDDVPNFEEDIILETDSDAGEEVHPLDEETNNNGFDESNNSGENKSMVPPTKLDVPVEQASPTLYFSSTLEQVSPSQYFFSPKRLERLNCLRKEDGDEQANAPPQSGNNENLDSIRGGIGHRRQLTRSLTVTERIGLNWPEPQLSLISERVKDRKKSSKPSKRLQPSKTLQPYSSCKSIMDRASGLAMFAGVDLVSLMNRKRRSSYVRIASKQMVGIFLTIWVRRSLRRHIQNVKVSTVGVGLMGYIGNKGSVSVSMSIYQTLFCFICTHLTAGEKYGDELKRNSDVHEIQRRTHFHSFSSIGLPKGIHDHERIFWLGDLNYRIKLSYDKARDLISKENWSELMKRDQLVWELRKGRTFSGWSEGVINFAPTYKYEPNSDKYYGEDPKIGRRIPSWCDRILSYGKGMRQLSYRRSELKFSDHRPVTAIYMAEVEVFCPRRLQRALTYTDAEMENEGVTAEGIGY